MMKQLKSWWKHRKYLMKVGLKVAAEVAFKTLIVITLLKLFNLI